MELSDGTLEDMYLCTSEQRGLRSVQRDAVLVSRDFDECFMANALFENGRKSEP